MLEYFLILLVAFFGQAIGVAETGHGRNQPAWPGNPDLLAQHVRHVVQNSKDAMAGHQVKTIVNERQLVGVSLNQLDLAGQGVPLDELRGDS